MLWEFVLKWGKRLGQADEGQGKAASRFSKVGPIFLERESNVLVGWLKLDRERKRDTLAHQ